MNGKLAAKEYDTGIIIYDGTHGSHFQRETLGLDRQSRTEGLLRLGGTALGLAQCARRLRLQLAQLDAALGDRPVGAGVILCTHWRVVVAE